MNKKKRIARGFIILFAISTIVLIWLLMATFLGAGSYIVHIAKISLLLGICFIWLMGLGTSSYLTLLFLADLFNIRTTTRKALLTSFGAITTGAISAILVYVFFLILKSQ